MNDISRYLTVTTLTRYIKYKVDTDEHLNHVYLKGEISNFKNHTRGHLYFTLKDENSKINAVMFAGNASKLKFKLEDGMKVLVTGNVSVYEPSGSYQIYVDELLEDGVGNLFIAFEQLKAKLEKEGLFNPSIKKKIPAIPETVGIITAPTGAAVKDILSTIKRRYPICKTILFPTLVQGPDAALNIVKQMKKAEEYNLDVLIIARGGGSIEDLWPFNEEIVARAIYECKIPTISAVGHEIDFTIADFVADLRAATPTAASELAVPNLSDLLNIIDQYKIRSNQSILAKVNEYKIILKKLEQSYVLKNPMNLYQMKSQNLDHMIDNLKRTILTIVEKSKTNLYVLKNSYVLNNPKILYELKQKKMEQLFDKMEVLNPLNTLKRGYSITYKESKVVHSIHDIEINDLLNIKMKDGFVQTKVIGKEGN